MNILIKLINDVKALCNTVITAVNAIKAKTDTITSNLFTATHASRIDANISSRQADAGLTTTHANRIDTSISSRQADAGLTTTHAGRIDTSISSRATNDGVWSAPNRFLTIVKSGTTTRLINTTVISPPNSGYGKAYEYKFKVPFDGVCSISVEYSLNASAYMSIEIYLNGVATNNGVSGNAVSSGAWTTITVPNVLVNTFSVISVKVLQNNTSGTTYFRNFKVMYDYDNLATPILL